MTWDELKTWLLRHDWRPVSVTVANLTPRNWQFVNDCENGKVLGRKAPDGLKWYVWMMKRNVRVFVRDDTGRIRNILTVHPNNIRMIDGMPRGMGLWTHPSPHQHGARV